MHTFDKSSSWEASISHEKFIHDGYAKYVAPKTITNTEWVKNGRQKEGLDKILHLSSNEKVGIEEKFRKKDYGDFLLEIWSSLEDKILGWCAKEIMADIVGYWIVPACTLYIFESKKLVQCLVDYRSDWEKFALSQQQGFRIADAKNPNYTTRSICVPHKILERYVKIEKIVI